MQSGCADLPPQSRHTSTTQISKTDMQTFRYSPWQVSYVEHSVFGACVLGPVFFQPSCRGLRRTLLSRVLTSTRFWRIKRACQVCGINRNYVFELTRLHNYAVSVWPCSHDLCTSRPGACEGLTCSLRWHSSILLSKRWMRHEV